VHKLPNGCAAGYVRAVPREEARHRLGLPPDRLVLFAFGNGFPHGRAVLILECVSRLARTFPDLEVLTNVVPEVHLWESARADSPPALTPELRARFRGVGHIPDADIGVYVAAADFALFLVADVPAERACSPIRVTAYLGGGCPIATTDVPTEARRLVADFGAGVIGPDPAAIAAAIAAAWRDPGRMAAMKAGARAACASLAYDRIARDLAAFYEGVAQRPPDGVSSPR
jgi:glycosyltransferase involved in cell wall biosynthesis